MGAFRLLSDMGEGNMGGGGGRDDRSGVLFKLESALLPMNSDDDDSGIMLCIDRGR
jgi:hypothetical protein